MIAPVDRRIAIIDLGSNSCRMVVFGCGADRSFKLVDQLSEQVRIGEGAARGNRLQPAPMARAVRLLAMFRALCDASGIDRVIATATSAVRDAVNRDEFLATVRRHARLDLRVLSGDEEARYAYLGVVNSTVLTDGFIADLGGGSLELTRVRDRQPVATASLPLGAVRLSEEFLRRDPIKPRQVRALLRHIDDGLRHVGWLRAHARDRLVVLGGTMRALAKLEQRRTRHPFRRLHGYQMSRRALRGWLRELLRRPLRTRKKLKGLKGERADVIPAGAAVIVRLMKRLGVKALGVSGQGLREGLFYEALLGAHARGRGAPVVDDVRAFGIANLGCVRGIDWTHAEHLADLALALFDGLGSLHRLGASERTLLAAAALLSDVGVVVDYYRHHHHSAYLIANADLPGFTQREIALIAQVVRSHRRSAPDLDPFTSILGKGDRERVRALSALLRLADDLERSHAQVVCAVRCRVRDDVVAIRLGTRGDAVLESWAAAQDAALFASVFGRPLRITTVMDGGASPSRPCRRAVAVWDCAQRVSRRLHPVSRPRRRTTR